MTRRRTTTTVTMIVCCWLCQMKLFYDRNVDLSWAAAYWWCSYLLFQFDGNHNWWSFRLHSIQLKVKENPFAMNSCLHLIKTNRLFLRETSRYIFKWLQWSSWSLDIRIRLLRSMFETSTTSLSFIWTLAFQSTWPMCSGKYHSNRSTIFHEYKSLR